MKLFLSILFLFSTSFSQAHTLKENSAQIIMRDGQVEIRLMVNMARWQSVLQNNEAWLLGDIQQVMPKHLTHKQQTHFLGDLVTQQTHVVVNDKSLKMGVLYFPDLEETLHLVDSNSHHHNDDLHDAEYVEIVLTAHHQLGRVDNITLALPKSLGNVHSRFVQPSYRLVKAGSQTRVSFKRHISTDSQLPARPTNNVTIHQPTHNGY